MQKEKFLDINRIAFLQRENFISTINHDLKVPIIAQIRALELLINENIGNLNNTQKEIINLTLDSCRSVYDLLIGILSLYKYENKDIILNPENINLPKLIESIFNNKKDLIEQKGIKISITKNLKHNLIYADRNQIQTAFEYIIENSISSTSVETCFNCELYEKDNMLCTTVIFDNMYLKYQHQKNIYTKLIPHKMDKVGKNLGLYLAQQIINSHKGKIESKNYNALSIFTICLPLTNIKIMP